MLEQLSAQQGTGQITLFFPTGSATIAQGSLQYDRLVHFLDYLSRESRGRKILFVMIGCASAIGNMEINQRLSTERADAPKPIIDQYLVNAPARVLPDRRCRRFLQPQGCLAVGGPAVPERPDHRRVADGSGPAPAGGRQGQGLAATRQTGFSGLAP